MFIRFRSALKKITDVDVITKKRLSSDNGKLIAFIGQDGAGKSTVTDEVLEWLNWKIDAKKFYLGSGDHYHSWQKSLRMRIGKTRSEIGKVFCDYLTLSDLLKQSRRTYNIIKKAKKYAKKGGIAIFDRYPQSKYLGINDGPKIRYSISNKKNV